MPSWGEQSAPWNAAYTYSARSFAWGLGGVIGAVIGGTCMFSRVTRSLLTFYAQLNRLPRNGLGFLDELHYSESIHIFCPVLWPPVSH